MLCLAIATVSHAQVQLLYAQAVFLTPPLSTLHANYALLFLTTAPPVILQFVSPVNLT